MVDRWGRPTMEDGLQIANSMIALQNYNEQNADRWTKNQAGAIALEQGENFDPNAASEKMKADPRFRAGAFQDSVEAQFHKMLNSEEFQTKKAQNSTLRAQITRNNIKAHANKAVGMWQAGDIEGAENEFLNAWDTVYDGKEIVRDESGAPIIDKEKNTIQVRTRGGEVKAIPKPTIEQMYKLASTASQEGFLEEAYPGWDKERAGYNLVQMKNTGMRWETEDGRKIITVENQYDPETNKKIPLVARDAETGEDIPIDQLSMMGLKQVGPLFESQKEPTGDYAQFVQYKNDNPGYKGDFLAFTKDKAIAGKGMSPGDGGDGGGVDLTELKKQLELVLMPLGKGVSEVVDLEGNITREGQTAFQAALKNLEEYKADPGKFQTDEQKAVVTASRNAVQLWQKHFGGQQQKQALDLGGKGKGSWRDYDIQPEPSRAAGQSALSGDVSGEQTQAITGASQQPPPSVMPVSAQQKTDPVEAKLKQFTNVRVDPKTGIIWGVKDGKTTRIMVKPPEKIYNNRYANPEYDQYRKMLEAINRSRA